jgi:uncharacterized protein YjiS (DUF1127 family)
MSTLALPHRAERLKTLLAAITDLFTGVGEGLEMAREYEALVRLTPSELAERGIRREDIPRLVARRLISA